MLYQTKAALAQGVRVSMIEIRLMELNFYIANLASIGSQAALLAGFLYPGIIYIVIPEGKNETLVTAYLCVAATAFGLCLMTVLNSLLCTILAPGLALRGPDGAVHRAVEDLLEEYRLAFAIFVLSLFTFYAAAFLLAYVLFVWTVGICCSALTAYFVYVTYSECRRIYIRFKVPPSLLITGRFDTDIAVYETSITAAYLRNANDMHMQDQSLGEQWEQYVSPIAYSQSVLEKTHGPAPDGNDGYVGGGRRTLRSMFSRSGPGT